MKKTSTRIETLILNQHKKNPGLGVRKLALLLKREYGINTSKSNIYSILKANKVRFKKGRKKALTAYKKKALSQCGLMLLRCIDNYLDFFAYLAEELNVYFPRLKKELLKKFIILASFAFSLGLNPEKALREKEYLRLAGLYRLPVRKFAYFRRQINRYSPVVDAQPVKNNLVIAAGVKIIFNDGSYLFSDPGMSTFWDSLPPAESFYLPLKASEKKVKAMLEERLLIIGYTKSFSYFSPLVFAFIKGAQKGVFCLKFMDRGGKTLKEIKVGNKLDCILGYHPKAVSKGIKFIKKQRQGKKFHFRQEGSINIIITLSKLLQEVNDEEVTSINVLMNDKSYGLPGWGLITSLTKISKAKRNKIVQNYMKLWPYREKSLLEGTKKIEASFLTRPKQKKEIIGILPAKLCFSKIQDFARISQLLSAVLKELSGGLEPKGQSGFLESGRDSIFLILEGLNRKVKEKLDRQAFFVDGKRVFFA